MRVVFMGTPAFGVPVLERLVASGHEVAAVVTQPDRPAGRSGKLLPPAVKTAALRLALPVLQPIRLRSPMVTEDLRRIAPEVIVVAAFGQILPRDVLPIPRHGALNVHASLLPRYRGAAPIAAAILAGERETGVTIMLMEAGLDTGPILAQRLEPIRDDDTAASLSARLSILGGDLLVEVLPRWVSGLIQPRLQDESEASYAPPLRREQGQIDWRKPAEQIARQWRAYSPWPGCHSFWNGRMIKLLAVRPIDLTLSNEPGRVVQAPGGELGVATARGTLVVDRLQLEGKRPVDASEFLRGQRGILGVLLDFHAPSPPPPKR